MKKLLRSFAVKLVSFILCAASIFVIAVCAFGAVVLVDNGFYTYTEEYTRESAMRNVFVDNAYNIVFKSLNARNNPYINDSELDRSNTNVRFLLIDPNGERAAGNAVDNLTEENEAWRYRYYFVVLENNDSFDITWIDQPTSENIESTYTLYAYLEEGLPIYDEYFVSSRVVSIGYDLRYAIFIIASLCAVIALICFVHLMCVSGKRPGTEEIHKGALSRMPTDLLIVLVGAMLVVLLALGLDLFSSKEFLTFFAILVWTFLALISALGLCVSLSVRIKQKSLIKNTLIYMLIKLIAKIIKFALRCIVGIPLVWRAFVLILAIVAFNILTYLAAIDSIELSIFMLVIGNVVFILLTLYIAICLKKIQKGGESLAKGELSYKVDTGWLVGDLKKHGEDLNSISDGMAKAVEERIKSERMKTELITNVSHDIKNPLTSIINYSSLIAEEKCESEKHREYADVLVRKSTHLKRLLDDLVEISKATTGNLEVNLGECDAEVLLTQAVGEFEERCSASGLKLVVSKPDVPMKINVDSKRIWRVFENLMSNACKYSLEGSRVYLSLEESNREAIFTFKNTSREALNISPDELMERFVRGDEARTTEGNGLGLSIAKSLTELQGGRMELFVDGDLFKAVLKFPKV